MIRCSENLTLNPTVTYRLSKKIMLLPIALQNGTSLAGLDSGTNPCVFSFFERWSMTGHHFNFSEKGFYFLVCWAHEMRSLGWPCLKSCYSITMWRKESCFSMMVASNDGLGLGTYSSQQQALVLHSISFNNIIILCIIDVDVLIILGEGMVTCPITKSWGTNPLTWPTTCRNVNSHLRRVTLVLVLAPFLNTAVPINTEYFKLCWGVSLPTIPVFTTILSPPTIDRLIYILVLAPPPNITAHWIPLCCRGEGSPANNNCIQHYTYSTHNRLTHSYTCTYWHHLQTPINPEYFMLSVSEEFPCQP